MLDAGGDLRVPTAREDRQAARRELRVGGVTPFTSIDFPGQLAAVVWVQGCPWRCRYCHNPHLQPRDAAGKSTAACDWPDVLTLLKRRMGLIDAVVFSGGEPTMDPGLPHAMTQVRALGLAVGLHTGGIYPRRLTEVLPLVDWVGLDIKAPLSNPQLLDAVVGVRARSHHVSRSLAELMRSGVKYECRTTAHPSYLSEADLLGLATELAELGVRDYVVQVARPVAGAPAALGTCVAYPSEATVSKLKSVFSNFALRSE